MPWDWIVERRLREAVAEGLFENLPGAGKPLRWDDDTLVPLSWRAAFHLLRKSGLAPAWIMLDVEIRDDLRVARQGFSRAAELLDDQDPEYMRAVEQFAHGLAKINKAIDELNLQVPSPRLTRERLNPDREIERIIRASISLGEGTLEARDSKTPP
jgi:DnaJ family protein C protein 28